MNKILIFLISSSLLFASAIAQAWEPDTGDKLELSVAQALINANEKDPTLAGSLSHFVSAARARGMLVYVMTCFTYSKRAGCMLNSRRPSASKSLV